MFAQQIRKKSSTINLANSFFHASSMNSNAGKNITLSNERIPTAFKERHNVDYRLVFLCSSSAIMMKNSQSY